MEVFEIFSTLNIKGNAFQKLKEFNQLIFNSSLLMSGLQKKLSLLSEGFTVLNTTLTKDNLGLKEFNTTISSLSLQTGTLTSKVEALALSLKEVSKSSIVATGSLRSMEGSAIGGEFAKGAGFGSFGGLFSRGNLAIMGAAGAGFMLHAGFKAQEEYQKKEAQLQALGFDPSYMGQVNQLVRSTNIPGVSRTDMLEAIVDAQMATRAGPNKFAEVKAFAPELARASMQTGILFNGMTDKQKKDLIRFAEIQGGSDPRNQLTWLKTGIQMIIASGGTIFPNQQLQFARLTSGSMRLTPQAYLALEPVAQELASRTGTGLTTGARAFGGSGSIPGFSRKNMEFWERTGIFKARLDKVGQPLDVHMADSSLSLLSTDPDQFLRRVLLPALSSKGISSPSAVHDALMGNLPRTFAMVINTLYKNMEKTDRARAMSGHIQTGDELQGSLDNKAAFASKRFQAAWQNFTLSIGKLSTPTVMRGMNALASTLGVLTKFFDWLGNTRPGTLGRSLVDPKSSNFQAFDMNNSLLSKMFGSAAPKNSASNSQGDVYLDGNKVGNVVAKHLAGKLSSAGAISSMTNVNTSFTLAPVGLSNYGTQQ